MLVKAGSGVLTAAGATGRADATETGGASSAGVPADFARHTVSLPYNDLTAVREFFAARGGDVAAVIVEPVAGNMGLVPPADGFLSELRALTQAAGALLICDEVINGFRFGLSTYTARFTDVTPDLVTLGKVIGGGLPLAAVGGRADLMDLFAPDGPVYQAGTLAGNPLAVAAGLKTLEILERDDPYARMEATARVLAEGVMDVARQKGVPARVSQFGGVFTLFCSEGPVRDRGGRACRCRCRSSAACSRSSVRRGRCGISSPRSAATRRFTRGSSMDSTSAVSTSRRRSSSAISSRPPMRPPSPMPSSRHSQIRCSRSLRVIFCNRSLNHV